MDIAPTYPINKTRVISYLRFVGWTTKWGILEPNMDVWMGETRIFFTLFGIFSGAMFDFRRIASVYANYMYISWGSAVIRSMIWFINTLLSIAIFRLCKWYVSVKLSRFRLRVSPWDGCKNHLKIIGYDSWVSLFYHIIVISGLR